MRFCIPDILNKSSSIITDKIKTHSRKGFSVYLKCFLVNAYNSIILFNTKLLFMFKNCCFVIHGALWTLALLGPIFAGACPGGFLGCSETPPPPRRLNKNILQCGPAISLPPHLAHSVSLPMANYVMKPGFINVMKRKLLNMSLYHVYVGLFSFLGYGQQQSALRQYRYCCEFNREPWILR